MIGLLPPLLLVVVSELIARFSTSHSDTLAPPSAIVQAFGDALLDGSLWVATRETLLTAFGGLACGGLIGLFVGILLGAVPVIDRLFTFPIEVIRPIPSVALIPIVMIAIGFGLRMEIVVVAFASVWPVLITSRAAVAALDPRLMEVARALRLSVPAQLFKIIMPAALPRIAVGFRLASGIALIVAVTVEIAGNPIGLGYAIMIAQQTLHPARMLALLMWIGVIGLVLNAGLLALQKRLPGGAA